MTMIMIGSGQPAVILLQLAGAPIGSHRVSLYFVMTEVREYTRVRNGEVEVVQAHDRNDRGMSSSSCYYQIKDADAVEAAKARLRAKGVNI